NTEPDKGWRTTMASTFMASILRAVSSKVSPLLVEDTLEAILSVSAERRLAASSKEMRVRVEGSKNRVTTVLPRKAGTFLMLRLETSLKDLAVSRMSSISWRLK